VAAGVVVGVLGYFGLLGADAKHQVVWAIIIGVFVTVLSFFQYRWQTFRDGSDPGSGQGTAAEKRTSQLLRDLRSDSQACTC
jgi:hypothetical protein